MRDAIRALLICMAAVAAGAAPRAATAQPAPVCPRAYFVFFDFGLSNLAENAQETVATAVRCIRQSHDATTRIAITGNTDTAEAPTRYYARGLGQRRAQSVKDEMVREGLDGARITILSAGNDMPTIPTGPNVREPQNRSALIEFGP